MAQLQVLHEKIKLTAWGIFNIDYFTLSSVKFIDFIQRKSNYFGIKVILIFIIQILDGCSSFHLRGTLYTILL